MDNQIEITRANLEHREVLISLLQSEGLPVEDLPQDLSKFYLATNNGLIVGGIGLETYDRDGLLRSLVVKREHRGKKIATRLINELEKLSKSLGLKKIFLLTEKAQDYFAMKGYEAIARNETPGSIKRSSEFTHTCPVSAIVMQKNL